MGCCRTQTIYYNTPKNTTPKTITSKKASNSSNLSPETLKAIEEGNKIREQITGGENRASKKEE